MTPELEERLRKGDARFESMEGQLKAIAAAVSGVPEMQADVAATREIVEAWNTAKNLGRFLKWIGPILAAIAGAYIWLKAGWVMLKD